LTKEKLSCLQNSQPPPNLQPGALCQKMASRQL
jgi:hypothetical protein